MTIVVRKAGLLTTVQDLGRTGYQKYGVIVSGVMDVHAASCANTLVGNDVSEAVLELTQIGPELYFEQAALIAICGADMQPTVGGVEIPLYKPVHIEAGSLLRFASARYGVRGYVAFAGGLRIDKIMDSYATYLRAGIGGYEGRALREGDRLEIGQPTSLGNAVQQYVRSSPEVAEAEAVNDGSEEKVAIRYPRWGASTYILPSYAADVVVRFLPGVNFDQFDATSIQYFTSSRYKLTPRSDRMGCRMEGPVLKLVQPLELSSEPVALGTVQVPPDGQPIILMADRQTTGGYPVIAHIISADLPLIAQTPIDGTVSFQQTDPSEAYRLWATVQRDLEQLRQGIRVIVQT